MNKAKVAKYKIERVDELAGLIRPYPFVGIVNMENIPAPQLQRMRSQLKDKLLISMSKKRLINLSIDASEKDKKGISELKKFITGMPALLFTKENPFKLASILKKSKTSAPAKAGQVSPRDIVIPAGPTQFAPGPIISELSAVGLKTGVEGGKVSIRQEQILVREGEKINQKVADVMAKLAIHPMEIGLDLVAIYENGTIYTKDVLAVDEQQYINDIKLTFSQARNLSVYIAFPTKDSINAIIGKAHNDAKSLAFAKELVSDLVVHKQAVDAERQAEAIYKLLPKQE
ncbi:50S ribosomal protein L10 [Candidatus Woesearchaeota archaeon]|nr:50S ribosomal protein L10 [Candidatus Woesearchaeota archaeon]